MLITEAKSNTEVVIAILKRNNYFLITSRPKGKAFENFWEFPGGKVEINESLTQALSRELNEELKIKTYQRDFSFLDSYEYEFSDKKINLNFFLCYRWFGRIIPNENQNFTWINKRDIFNFNFLPSNNKIIGSL